MHVHLCIKELFSAALLFVEFFLNLYFHFVLKTLSHYCFETVDLKSCIHVLRVPNVHVHSTCIIEYHFISWAVLINIFLSSNRYMYIQLQLHKLCYL